MVSVVAATYCGYFYFNNYILRYFVLLDLSNRNFGVGRFIFFAMIEALIMYLCGLIPWIAIILLGIARNHEDKDE